MNHFISFILIYSFFMFHFFSFAINHEESEKLFQIGYNHYCNKEYIESLEYFLKAAKFDHDESCLGIGNMYLYGEGVSVDYEEARKWYLLAAERGYARAQNNLGMLYFKWEKKYEEAFKWFHVAAINDHIDAIHMLGSFYACGFGIAIDYEEARKWYLLAAERGHVESQYNLAIIYFEGYGVDKDDRECLKWLDLPIKQNHKDAMYLMGIYHEKKENYEKAFAWYLRAAKERQRRAQYNLGGFYFNGYGVLIDYDQALFWFLKAFENGYEDANDAIDVLYKTIKLSAVEYFEN